MQHSTAGERRSAMLEGDAGTVGGAGPLALLGDIGGTHARFALADVGEGATRAPAVRDERKLAVAEYAGPEEAIAAYLAMVGNPALHAAALALAAPVHSDAREIGLTNAAWTFSRPAICARFALRRLVLLNDFSALALALPHLAASDLRQVGGGLPLPGAPKAVLGPGTGLGVSGLLLERGRWLAVAGEGGHVSLAPADTRECAILGLAWREHRHVSAERLVSGSGLPLLHRLVAEVDGLPWAPLTTEQIVERGVAGQDLGCTSALNTFCALLGGVAGNVALALGAQGGVYIGGGIVPRLGSFFDRSPFRARFEAKGRFAEYLAAIPAYVILSASAPALLGAAHALSTDALGANDE
jgi:glucokinase